MTHILTIHVSYNHAPKTWEKQIGSGFKHSGLNKENEEILQHVFLTSQVTFIYRAHWKTTWAGQSAK